MSVHNCPSCTCTKKVVIDDLTAKARKKAISLSNKAKAFERGQIHKVQYEGVKLLVDMSYSFNWDDIFIVSVEIGSTKNILINIIKNYIDDMSDSGEEFLLIPEINEVAKALRKEVKEFRAECRKFAEDNNLDAQDFSDWVEYLS